MGSALHVWSRGITTYTDLICNSSSRQRLFIFLQAQPTMYWNAQVKRNGVVVCYQVLMTETVQQLLQKRQSQIYWCEIVSENSHGELLGNNAQINHTPKSYIKYYVVRVRPILCAKLSFWCYSLLLWGWRSWIWQHCAFSLRARRSAK